MNPTFQVAQCSSRSDEAKVAVRLQPTVNASPNPAASRQRRLRPQPAPRACSLPSDLCYASLTRRSTAGRPYWPARCGVSVSRRSASPRHAMKTTSNLAQVLGAKRERRIARSASFPSPLPSPLGRGRTVASRKANRSALELSSCGLCCSLSLRERERVRGNRPSFNSARKTSPETVPFGSERHTGQ